MLTAIATVVLLLVVAGLYFMLSDGAQTANNKPVHGQETFRIETADGPAEVYRNGQRVGTTSYPFQAKPGEELDFVLKREGYFDKAVHLTTSTNQKTRTFMLEKKP